MAQLKLIYTDTKQEIKPGDKIRATFGPKRTDDIFEVITIGPRGNKPGTIRVRSRSRIVLNNPRVYGAEIVAKY